MAKSIVILDYNLVLPQLAEILLTREASPHRSRMDSPMAQSPSKSSTNRTRPHDGCPP